MKNTKTINWINILRAICIILVFLRHSENYYGKNLGWFDGFYLTIYVNAFFFVSGYLLFWKQLSSPKIDEDKALYVSRNGGGKALLNNVIFRIVIPSILFSVIEFFPSCIIQDRGIDIEFALYKTIGGGTYWFTSALAVSELTLLFLLCTRKRNIWFYVTISFVLCLTGLIIVKLGILNFSFWMWKHGLLAMAFLALGGLYWRYEKQIDNLIRWWFVIPLIIVYVSMVLGLKDFANPLVSTLTIQPLGYVTSTIACLLMLWFCKKMPELKLLTFIGQNSLGFYFMSGALPIVFSMVANKFLTSGSVLVMLAIWIACSVIAYLAVLFINRWLPWVWDLRYVKKL